MVQRAAVAVVGGGVVGASVAYHLAKRGVLDVVVLDRGAGPGNGSTSRVMGAQPAVRKCYDYLLPATR